MYFTQEDYKKIEEYLKQNSQKDTDFPTATEVSNDDYVPIVQDNVNKKMTVKDLRSELSEGPQGESAYEAAVRHGYHGTEEEWLASLQGESAYQIACDEGFIGTPEEWLASLKGEKGDNADIWTIGEDGYWYCNGVKTKFISKGDKGEDGKDGQSPILRISADGQSLEISSDGGETWYPFEKNFNKLRVLGYVDSKSLLPKSANVGDIYGVKLPNEEVEPGHAAYQLWINTVVDWDEDYTITKVYDYDTELPSSAADGTTVLVPISLGETEKVLDKEKIDGYKVYKYNASSSGWVMILNTDVIYANKEDIVNYGDNLYALVQGDGYLTETKLREETTVSKRDYCRIVNRTNGSLTLIITQDSKKMFHSIGTGQYMLPNGCGVFLVKDQDLSNMIVAQSLTDPEPKNVTDFEYMPEGFSPYYILTEDAVGDIYIANTGDIPQSEDEAKNALTVETKTTTLISFKQNYILYRRVTDWVYFGTNASITYVLIHELNEGASDNILDGEVVKTGLLLLARGVNAKLSASPSTIYKNTATAVTLTGVVNKAQVSQIERLTILDNGAQVATSPTSPITYASNITVNADTKTFDLEAIVRGMIFPDTVTINARYPIYYGFGANAEAVAIDANKFSPTISAVQTYTKTNNADGLHFYILVPTDITDVNNFTMGGAPFVMNTATTQTIGGVSYKVHESGNVYNSGVELIVSATH